MNIIYLFIIHMYLDGYWRAEMWPSFSLPIQKLPCTSQILYIVLSQALSFRILSNTVLDAPLPSIILQLLLPGIREQLFFQLSDTNTGLMLMLTLITTVLYCFSSYTIYNCFLKMFQSFHIIYNLLFISFHWH